MMWTFLSKPAQGPIHVNPINPGEIQFDRTLPCCMGGRAPTIAKTFVLRYTLTPPAPIPSIPYISVKAGGLSGCFFVRLLPIYSVSPRCAIPFVIRGGISHSRRRSQRAILFFPKHFMNIPLFGWHCLPWTYTIRRPTMATNTKMLELTFNVEGGRSMILSIHSPKEDLTLATQRLFHIDCYRPLRMTARGILRSITPSPLFLR